MPPDEPTWLIQDEAPPQPAVLSDSLLNSLAPRVREALLSGDLLNKFAVPPTSEATPRPRSCYFCGRHEGDTVYEFNGSTAITELFPEDSEGGVALGHGAFDVVGYDAGICTRCVTTCRNCGRTVRERGAMPYRDLHYEYTENCHICSVYCGVCEQAVPRDYVRTVMNSDGYRVSACDDCYDECYDCGNEIVAERQCFYCFDSKPSHRVRGYSYKPAPNFLGANNNSHPQLFIGIEQELEAKQGRQAHIDKAVALLDRVDTDHVLYSKSDGSLDVGIEIVSHPMSLDFFRDEYPWDLWKRGEGLGQWLHQNSHTGVHIHVSKAAFTKAHAYRFTAFHFLNPDFIEDVAGRPSNHYTNIRPYGMMPEAERIAKLGRARDFMSHLNQQAKAKTYNYDRYWAINAQNLETLELRYFRSTTDANRLKFYGEWIEACYEYTNTGWIRTRKAERRLNPVNFSKWVQSRQSGRWPNIEKFLVKQQLA